MLRPTGWRGGFPGATLRNQRLPDLQCDGPGGQILIRQFATQGKTFGLFVNATTLKTSVSPFADSSCQPAGAAFSQTNYGLLLAESRTHDTSLQDSGVTRSYGGTGHVMLTVDLCPSSRPYEAGFFALVARDVNVRDEVLGNEIKMLENGLTPSIFFRFPGLISDQKILDEVVSWGIVPLGADAWLALGENARPGSIVLVHGNGNEPHGIALFMRDLPAFLRMGFDSLEDGLSSH